MNTNSILLGGLLFTLALCALSIFVLRSPSPNGPSPWTQFFLVALRLSIGWHFMVEGLDKLNSPTWSSEPYLREAAGPLAPHFRELAGDRLIDKLTPAGDGSFPPELAIEWQAYLDGVISFYELDAEQVKQAGSVLEQAKAKTLAWLKSTPKLVQKASEYPPPLMMEMTIPQRLEEYSALDKKVHAIERIDIPQYGPEAFAKYKIAKGQLNKWRSELKADLDKQTVEFKQVLRDKVLVDIALKALPPEDKARVNPKDPVPSLQTIYHQLQLRKASTEAVDLPPQAAKVFEYAIDKKKDKQDSNDLLPAPGPLQLPARPMASWKMLDWSDFLVKWGILLVGVFLLVGFLTRTSCLLGACLLLMFFLAMPPLPGWPESPRAEGHYLYINKNIIEMLALLTLATTRSGRWAGLDGIFQFCCPRRWKNAP